jgi:hypothetical protein
MKAKIARFDANQTPIITNMVVMNAHFGLPPKSLFDHEKIPRLCGHDSLSPETQLPKRVKDPNWNPTGLYRVLPRQRVPERCPR